MNNQKKIVRSNRRFQLKFSNFDASNSKRKKLKKILLIAAFSIAVGCVCYTYPPLKSVCQRIYSRVIKCIGNNSNSDTLFDTVNSGKKNRLRIALIVGMTLLSSIMIANPKVFGECTLTSESVIESKYDINNNDVVALPMLITVFPLLISFMQQPISGFIYTSLWVVSSNLPE